ncbi:marine proteobacterial sortase target protein [Nitrospira sp. KM1]|uniref:marine proteobacterial sortase target protein n=1 Tax=Nitrospira sp. KM1 TaxID=1936990 RepID=UPI0013A7B489|nr:marine proteobacterial sortase target protein [Nitrospira sp. KM1]BCA56075.1 marine proteobacterial sortase target protein [Nitrospira sp. KM1]
MTQTTIGRRISLLHLCALATLFSFFSFAGGLPLLLACGEKPAPSPATTWVGLKDVTQGSLLFKTAESGRYIPAPALQTDAEITITGIVSRTKLKQEFINSSRNKDDWAEGIYVFPLPETAAVDHLRMKVGDRTIEGQIKERAEAKKIYDRAKQVGKRASLVEQERPNVFTTSVANIAPGDRITVEIEYQETVRYDQGTYSIRFPMVVGPRYIPGTPVVAEDQLSGPDWSSDTDRVPDASRITPPLAHPQQGPLNPVNLTIDLAAGFPLGKIESPYHDILDISDPDGRRHITLRNEDEPANRDFVLKWEPSRGISPTATAFQQLHNGGSYSLLMLSPPASPDMPVARQPREAIFVIDTSGSMAGTSIEQARAALLLALTRLTTQDRFNVIQFNSVTRVLFSQAQPVNTATIRKAVRYVERLHANGGTEILPAIKMALKGAAPPTHLRQVIFLTDGQVGNENELFEIIRSRLGGSRLFTIGIGSAPNSHFMRKAAEFGRGTFMHIGSVNEVKTQMDAMFRKLERPVLTGLQVEGLDEGAEMFPTRVPDLYDGEPIVVAVRSTVVPAALTFRGSIGGKPWFSTVPLRDSPSRDGMSVFWARRKIDWLMDQQRNDQNDDSAVRQAVTDVALAHHLAGKYTSLVAVDTDPVRPTDKSLINHAIKTNLPDGQVYEALFGLPRTAAGWQFQLMAGMAMLSAAGLLWMYGAAQVRLRP